MAALLASLIFLQALATRLSQPAGQESMTNVDWGTWSLFLVSESNKRFLDEQDAVFYCLTCTVKTALCVRDMCETFN